MTVAFPGLSCDMLFVVASIGSDVLLGTEALQSCLPHQLDIRMGKLWAEGRSTLQLHQQRVTHDVKGFLKTSVVLPPDSDIVAQFSVPAGGSAGILLTGGAIYDINGRIWRGGRTHTGRWFFVVGQCLNGES